MQRVEKIRNRYPKENEMTCNSY